MNQDQDTKTRMQILLDSLDYDFRQFTRAGFVEWLERRRERKITLVPYSLPSGIFGAWVKGTGEDYVFYDQHTPAVHQVHIQLHEMCHMLCGHPTVDLSQTGGKRTIHSLLLRSAHSDENEQEAEMLTSLIQTKILRNHRLNELTQVVPADPKLAIYIRSMGIS